MANDEEEEEDGGGGEQEAICFLKRQSESTGAAGGKRCVRSRFFVERLVFAKIAAEGGSGKEAAPRA